VKPLSRTTAGRERAPIRQVHLGLGGFFRAHQAWYTDRAPDAGDWGIAAFAGRSAALAEALSAQEGLYLLVVRSADGDEVTPVSSVSAAYAGTDQADWLRLIASPDVQVLTMTVTEAGYCLASDGGLDQKNVAVQHDLAALRADPTAAVTTPPARLVAGLRGRLAAGAGPLTIVPCDNLPDNGAAARRAIADLAARLDPSLAADLAQLVGVVTTVVDRITPRVTADDVTALAAATGLADRAPVITEPFSEWVINGSFAAARPRWEDTGVVFTDDIGDFARRKLWLLNGGHSLLAYAAAPLGHRTVAEAVADDRCRGWLGDWWAEASLHLDRPAAELAGYRVALEARFNNPRIEHRLAQIAADGSQKLPVRILPVLRAERAAGRVPSGAVRALAGWLCHLRGAGPPVDDPRADELTALAAGRITTAARDVLTALDQELGADDDVVAAVAALATELEPG
jgi:fructuronate reductase